MKYRILIILILIGSSLAGKAQNVKFTEFDLDNGLHVILHQDRSIPVAAVSVMYRVGSKDENPERTGFAHFFEHLLFEGSENIKRGEFVKFVNGGGGSNNANTSRDRTYYYEVFPSNELELGLWLESERMLHPKIDEVGVRTQNEVVKEEKRMRLDNSPYGNFNESIYTHLFEGHPYSWQPIGSMQHLDAARLDEFLAFFKKYYIPNNAVLAIAGNIDIENTKALVARYFKNIPKGTPIIRKEYPLKPLTHQIVDTTYDANIEMPAILTAYRIPGNNLREAGVLRMIASLLSEGGSSRLSAKLVDDKKTAVQVSAFYSGMEQHGVYTTLAFPNKNTPLNDLLTDIDAEVARLQTELVPDPELTKLKKLFENNFVSRNTRMIGLAETLSNDYLFKNGNTNAVNQELSECQSITSEEIKKVAKKYLNKDNRIVLYYLPKPSASTK
jgi:zinc protease